MNEPLKPIEGLFGTLHSLRTQLDQAKTSSDIAHWKSLAESIQLECTTLRAQLHTFERAHADDTLRLQMRADQGLMCMLLQPEEVEKYRDQAENHREECQTIKVKVLAEELRVR
jgi:hypothetical protein